ncbi:MAG: O-antigen ligase family protein [Candidatus Levybacteria bacterium]|nr:O-antigen ligase family protein [Candidatus Levybacteria bacterium]
MKKILTLIDNNILRFGVAFAILFTALYPKLPSVHINNTWVYIRLEDFVILALALIWFIQLLRKKVSLPRPEGYALLLYWLGGLVSLLYCLTFIAPTLVNFFPTVAWLQYFRRIEYMILFFIAFSSVKNVKDVYFYLTTLCVTLIGIIFYAFGQRFYTLLWAAFPDFFQKYPFCFPAFLTGNEEFAKGVPLCLNELSRVNATFGGHYDLSAYLVMVIPILVALVFAVKRWWMKIVLIVLALFALEVLNFTSSRTSFGAYVVGITGMLILWHKKRWIIPVLAVSLGVMLLFGSATIQRFSNTIQEVQVVSTENALPSDLQKIIADAKKAEEIKNSEVPPASDFTVGSNPTATQSGYTTILTDEQLKRIQADNISISSVSGTFLIKKAYALDVSFTTRFQAEWPRNWNAFLYSPVFGTGYSSLTLATDNDYLRALGETGLVGFLTFLFIFVILGIFMRMSVIHVKDPIVRAFMFGLAGGVIGLLINAVLIDVFEASKVAEPLWILLGIGVGAAKLYQKEPINYKKELFHFFTAPIMILLYLLLLIIIAYGASVGNFFVADDFTWLRWAATATPSDLPLYFINSQDFFYRPLDKVIVYYLYMLFSFQPEGYHVFMLFIHFVTTVGVYLLATRLTKRKVLGLATAALFAVLPAHTENIFWFSTMSLGLSAMFIVYAMLAYLAFRNRNSITAYIVAIILSALAFVTYEISVIIPFIFIVIDIFIIKPKRALKTVLAYVPFFILLILYFVMRSVSGAFSGGGDYSYNLTKLVPNVLGNFLGYIGMYFGGVSFLPVYDGLRGNLRSQWVTLSLFGLLLIGGIGYIIMRFKKHVLKLLKNDHVQLILFGLLFAFVTLIPFLPLGNIAPRYMYVASIGFSLSFVVLLYVVLKHFIRNAVIVTVSLILIISVFIGAFFMQNKEEQKKWETAGVIAEETLLFFRTGYASFSSQDVVYLVNVPVTFNGVWLFPVGLPDGLWFIYRESTPRIMQTNSLDSAIDAKSKSPTNTYIFQFNNGTIAEVK